MKHLDDFEQRMEQASQEVRRSAKHSGPATTREQSAPWRASGMADGRRHIRRCDRALLTVYTHKELDQAAGFGSYALWRIGITESGEWQFFVAGD